RGPFGNRFAPDGERPARRSKKGGLLPSSRRTPRGPPVGEPGRADPGIATVAGSTGPAGGPPWGGRGARSPWASSGAAVRACGGGQELESGAVNHRGAAMTGSGWGGE